MIYYQDESIEIREIIEADVVPLMICRIDKVLNQFDPRPIPYDSQTLLKTCTLHCEQFESEIILKAIEERSNHYFIVTNREGHFIGFVNFFNVDFEKGQGEMGIIISERRMWNKGVAFLSLLVAMEYIFSHMPLERIIVETSASNLQALGLFRKLQFKQCSEYSEADGFNFKVLEMTRDNFSRMQCG